MESQRDLALVLRSVAFEERHRIVTALTEHHGVVSALARNAIQSRRFGGSLDLFTASEWVFTEKPGAELLRLTDTTVRRAFEGIRSDFERLAFASAMNELVLRAAPKNQPCTDLFKLLSNALAFLDENAVSEGVGLRVLNAFLIKLLHWGGTQPRMNSCLECGKALSELKEEDRVLFRIAQAGWLCPQCGTQGYKASGNSNSLSLWAIHDFLIGLNTPIRQAPQAMRASEADHQQLYGFLYGLMAYHLPGMDRLDQQPIKSLRFLGLESIPPPEAENPR